MERSVKSIATMAALSLIGLSACSEGSETAQGGDKYAGLDQAIKGWHAQIKSDPQQCVAKDDGNGCQGFEVACKGERELAAEDQAKGVAAKIVVAMSWEGWDPAREEYRTASSFAEFNKIGDEWTRSATGPVNLATCVST